MAEKAAGKKDHQQQQQQQKNKKGKQNEKKKNQENGVKPVNKHQVQNKNHMGQKKKDKGNKNNNKGMSKKKPGTTRSVFRLFFTQAIFIFIFVGFLYIVDYEKYTKIRDGAEVFLNKTVSLLPAPVTEKGRHVAEALRPTVETSLGILRKVANQTSTFVNTNPLIKDHWSNIREISSIFSARLVDYMRTLYLQVTGYCQDVKNKLFQ